MKKVYLLLTIVLLISSCQQQEKKETSMENKKNEVVENILKRRSIRSYKPDLINQNQMDTILQCAINAPSALNKQSWEVRVIQNQELLKEINDGFINYAKEKNMPGSASRVNEPGFSVFHGAPVLIIVASEKDNFYSPIDCGLLGQNILLAAESMDIGTCVIGSLKAYFDTPEAQEKIIPRFELSEGYEVLYTISIGYKNEYPDAKPRDKAKAKIIR